MKKIFWIILFIASFSNAAFAQCETEPTIEKTGKVLREIKVFVGRAKAPIEFQLKIKASVKGAAWHIKGAEAAVLTVFVDGKYNQDAVLFAGEKIFEYQMPLGQIRAGEHKITIVLNEARSAPNAKNVVIHTANSGAFENFTAQSKSTERSVPAYLAVSNAPIIYLRPDTIDKFSDVPLLTFYEIFDEPENVKKIRYTTIFTNEDGGTQSAALMARWGRMTDIEWIYEMRVRETGEIVSEIYQAANHETKSYNGKRFGSHPLIFNATVNNNFAASGCSPLRVAPMLVHANLADGSRETVMDAFPWTYQIMAREAIREGRVDATKLGANIIADPRAYLFAEIYSEPKNAAINAEAQIFENEKYSSDAGVESLRVNRPGYVRIALRLPPNRTAEFPKTINVGCYALSGKTSAESVCQNVRLVKLIRLDENYLPVIKEINGAAQTIKTGEKAVFSP